MLRFFFLVVLLPALALADFYKPITYATDNKFSDIERKIIVEAVNKVAARFLDPQMFECTKRNYVRWRMRGDYMQKAGVDLKGDTNHFHHWFHQVEMQALRGKGFPKLTIYAYNKNDNTTGFAYNNQQVFGDFVTPTDGFSLVPFPRVRGEFVIYLNQHWLGSADAIGHDSDYWAGTIAHEMLHNLGHHHNEGEYDGLFIRDYENCVSSNGTYQKGFGLTPHSGRFNN